MAVTEKDRHKLYGRLEEVLGPEEAGVLMDHLPPLGWADVASKRDVDGIERRLDGIERRIDGIERRLDGLESGMRSFFLALLSAQVGLTALLYNLLS